MKKIGLVGGIGPASTMEYYRELVRLYREDASTTGYPEIVIDSVDMTQHDEALEKKDYDLLAQYLLASLRNLKAAGAQVAGITANTEHIVWEKISHDLPLPTVNLLAAAAKEIKAKQYQNILILGTGWTMSSKLFEKIIMDLGKHPITPGNEDQKEIGKLIYPNLENGIVIMADKQKMIKMIGKYCHKYAVDAVLFGCTELPLMLKSADIKVPIINTAEIHIREILKQALTI